MTNIRLETVFLSLCLMGSALPLGLKHAQAGEISWPAGKSAVAWRTRKTLFLVKSEEPVGINTAISVSAPQVSGKRVVTVTIPIDQFDSGERMRDRDVFKTLKGKIQSSIEFKSSELDESSWQSLLKGDLKALKGNLKIGGELFPVNFAITMSTSGSAHVIEGILSTTFTAFKIDPPSMVGGVISNVKDELHLQFRIYEKDVKGL